LRFSIEIEKKTKPVQKEWHCIFFLKKQLMDELLAKAIIEGGRNIKVEFRAKIIDLAVNKEILDLPNSGAIAARL